jgi:hypothetical protein
VSRLTPPEILVLTACQVPDLEPVQIKSVSSPQRDSLTARDGKACTWLASKANNLQEASQDGTDWRAYRPAETPLVDGCRLSCRLAEI